MPFVFYDTETTGSDPVWDQILQFAAIRTDDDLNETDRLEIRCRLQPHVVPSPGALVVTGVTIGQLTDPAQPSHCEMMRVLQAKLSAWSPAVFLGYNSFEFDEVLLRQALYQTLHPPYLTNTNGNGRADVMQLVLAVEQFFPGVLAFRQRHDGKPSFGLDQVAPANGFDHAHAHDALADVAATIFLARLIRARAPEFWKRMIGLANKPVAIGEALAGTVFLYTEFNHNRPHHWMVSPFAVDPGHGGHVLAYDLAVDPGPVMSLGEEALQHRLNSPPKLLRPIKTNACPLLQPWQQGEGKVEAFALGEMELLRRAGAVQADAGFRARLVAAHLRARKEHEPSAYVEEQIYDGFPGSADLRRMAQFHLAAWPERLVLVDQFEDRRLRRLALRLLYLERPDVLDARVRTEVERRMAERLLATGTVPWLTPQRAIDDAEDLIGRLGSADGIRLRDLQDYLKSRVRWAEGVAGTGATGPSA